MIFSCGSDGSARSPDEKPLQGDVMDALSVSALSEIGNQVESELRARTIKEISAVREDEAAARAARLAGVSWFKQ